MSSILSKTQQKKKYTLKELKTLGRELLSSRAHINNLPLLLTFVSSESSPQFVVESVLSLQSFFTPLLPQLPPSSSGSKRRRVEDDSSMKPEDDDPEFIYKTWVRSKFDEFVKLLIDILASEQSEDALREIVLDTLMEFVKLGNGGRFNSAIYHRLLHAILHSAVSVDLFSDSLASKYFKYIDVRYFTHISMEKLIKTLEGTLVSGDSICVSGSGTKESVEQSIRKIYYILSRVPPLQKPAENMDHEMWSISGSTSYLDKASNIKKSENKHLKTDKSDINGLSPATIVKRMKLKFTKAWISFLRLPLPTDIYKEVLVTLHQAVIPHLSNPAMLCDFLTKSYDIGGVVSVMALSSLFILMTEHGLEYPNFYDKLYALLVPSIFMAKHRARFFQLLDTCLKSPLLPAYLAASFTKKLSRLSLSIPPSGSLVIIALIHNLLRRHPSINCLVHREPNQEKEEDNEKAEENPNKSHDDGKGKASRKPGIDHFKNEETNPMKSSAMKSSLWEIDSLRNHYCPPVSRFVLSLENDLTVRAKTTEINIEDFCSGSYATIFGDEIRRRVKQVPLAFYKTVPTSLFAESDFAGWTFKHDQSIEHGTGHDSNALEENRNASAKRLRVES